MAFELDPGKPLKKSARQVAVDRIDAALEALDGGVASGDNSPVHEARKRFKEIRALLRLLRTDLPRRQFESAIETIRSAGRSLAAVRDADVTVAAIQRLASGENGISGSLDSVCGALKTHRRLLQAELVGGGRLEQIRGSLLAARSELGGLSLKHGGFKAIRRGLRRSYKRAGTAMQQAAVDRSDANLHEWRKRAKDLRYHLELLSELDRSTIGPMAEEAHQLTDLLGEDHDLAMLGHALAALPPETLPAEARAILASRVEARRAELQSSALGCGRSLLSAKPREFVQRIELAWRSCSR